MNTPSFAALSAAGQLERYMIERRPVGANDIQINIDYCGVCHTDLHYVNNDWGDARYPLVPGHEIIGRVGAVGSNVTNFTVGQRVGVGCMVDSCRVCNSCKVDLQQYCGSKTMTYASNTQDPGGVTHGGYSKSIVVDSSFVLNVPENLDPSAAAPLLCAGITTYSPLAHWKIGPGMTVGVIGLGGLGHMGIKFAKAMGAKTVAITSSASKVEAAKQLGADDVLISSGDMNHYNKQFDFLLNTIPVQHNFTPYMQLLKIDGTMCIVGSIGPTGMLNTAPLIMGRRQITGSLIGGIKETQEMLDFCGQHNIVSDVEVINIQDINNAYVRMQSNDVKYRFVIDMDTLAPL
jgi:uncharacterized zinc-type alcohol dehydrogenase-like protein